MQDALDQLTPPGFPKERWQRNLIRNALAEGLFALADNLGQNGSLKLGIRFDVANGARRGFEREQQADAIETLLERAKLDADAA